VGKVHWEKNRLAPLSEALEKPELYF
jgi:hypothetical protein